MEQSLDIPRVIKDDWKRLDLIINKIRFKLGHQSSPKFADMTLTGLTASRLVATDSDKVFESVSGTSSHPEFAGITLKDPGDNIVLHMNSDEFYITTMPTTPITGNPMFGWLFWFTYTE